MTLRGDAVQFFGSLSLPAGQLPDEAVVEAELLDLAVADAVGPAVADVADPGAFGPQHEAGGRGAHALEFAVLPGRGCGCAVGFDEGLAQGDDGAFVGVLGIDVRDAVGGQLAGQLADGVRAHAVGHQENVAAAALLLQVAGRQGRVGVLVVTAPHAHVGQACVFDVVEANHPRLPRTGSSPQFITYRTAGARQLVVRREWVKFDACGAGVSPARCSRDGRTTN